jgi:endonuclease YncB( thermonuclease family)
MTTTRTDLYRYQATIVAWHDGDTAHALVDLGCHVHWAGSVRCAGYNSPEIYGTSKPAGLAALAYVQTLAPVASVVYLDSLAFSYGALAEEDSFGRMLAAVTLADGRDLSTLMIDGGYAVAD